MNGVEVGWIVTAAAVGYLLGAINPAAIIAKARGIDLNSSGSGNPGATNAARVMGRKTGILVLIFDVLKGLVPVLVFSALATPPVGGIAGFAAILGHMTSPFLKGKGGKGVATLAGMLFALQPIVALCCVGVFLLVLFLTRYVSLSSILAGLALPVFVLWIWRDDVIVYRVFAIAVAVLVVLTHKKNIVRLLKGVESQVPILKYRDRRKSRRRNEL